MDAYRFFMYFVKKCHSTSLQGSTSGLGSHHRIQPLSHMLVSHMLVNDITSRSDMFAAETLTEYNSDAIFIHTKYLAPIFNQNGEEIKADKFPWKANCRFIIALGAVLVKNVGGENVYRATFRIRQLKVLDYNTTKCALDD